MRQLFKSVFILVLVTGFMLLVVSMFPSVDRQTHSFSGERTFTTLEEVQKFQVDVITATKEAGGSVESFNLTVLSPPRVSYLLYIPNVTSFTYGEEVKTTREAKNDKFAAGILAILVSFGTLIVLGGSKSQ